MVDKLVFRSWTRLGMALEAAVLLGLVVFLLATALATAYLGLPGMASFLEFPILG